MIFCGIVETEQIDLHPDNDLDKLYSISLTMDKHEPKFYVWSDYNKQWFWEFWYLSKTNYEKIKYCIIDVASECNDIAETLNALTQVFFEYFDDVLVSEEDMCQYENENCSSLLN